LEKWWVLFGFSFSDGRSITEKMINPGIKPGSPEDTECVRNEKQKKDFYYNCSAFNVLFFHMWM
jgi:hypothetical protein